MHPVLIRELLTAKVPSKILEYLYGSMKLDSELEALVNTAQDAKNHPEGNVFVHTCMVLDEAALISAREGLDEFSNAVLRLAALTHDFGKPATTVVYEDGKVTAHNHPEMGVKPANIFLTHSKVHPLVIDHVLPLVREHMAHVGFYTPDITTRVVRRLITRLQPTDIGMLAYVIEADHSGRGGNYFKSGLPERMNQILTVYAQIDEVVYPDPIISGDDIMAELNIGPSRQLGQIKDMLYQAQLDGKFDNRYDGILYLRAHVEDRRS